MVDPLKTIWMDGKEIPWDQAQVHVLTHSLHYGVAAFEGIRCYKLKDGASAIFRLHEHIKRLVESAKIAMLALPFSQKQIEDACVGVVRSNGLDECYLRPIAWMGSGAMGLGARNNPVHVAVIAWRWGAYLGDEGLEKGIRCKISSFSRAGVNSLMSKAKISGHYVNSILAKHEVASMGFDEAIMLDAAGYVCEASGENIFIVKDGVVSTPPVGVSVLGGITRDSVMTLLKRQNVTVVERLISRDELYIADEVFLVGTAAEITPVREVDGRTVGEGKRGPLTQKVQTMYFDAVRGASAPDAKWLTKI